MKPYTKEILQNMTPKAAAQAVFSNDPDTRNPFPINTQEWFRFRYELRILEVTENG